MQTLSDIISYIRTQPDSEKGRLFESLCLYFLKHDTLQQNLYSDAWLWKFWPGNNSNPDTGIDIVAKVCDSDSSSAVSGDVQHNLANDDDTTIPSASFCAVQCKFRQDDSTIIKSEIDSFLAASSKAIFSQRIIFSLTGNFGGHAPQTLTGQTPPVKLLTLSDLEASSIDWSAFSFDSPENVSYSVKELLPHQIKAVDDVMQGFSQHDRGRLIMACGTGKTFTSLKIAERLAGAGGLVLVLVPSISLLNQTLLAWSYDHDKNIPLRAFAVCSDDTVGRDSEDLKLSDLAIPPTTNAADLLKTYSHNPESMTVIFSTYQSLHVIHDAQNQPVDGDAHTDAQKNVLPDFDIVICDEAHRTAGITLSGQDDSLFRKIHDPEYIHSLKRLYMTATPKVYGDNQDSKAAIKQKAQDRSAILYDMDNPEIFGPVFHWLTFSQAVEQNLLADYKVIVFMTTKHSPTDPDLPAMIQGVRKALAKDISPEDYDFIETDPPPMHTAVAFSNTITNSKAFTENCNEHPDSDSAIVCEVKHIDGKTPARVRSDRLRWLRDSHNPNECRILSNARCLSEGVDVPALDAIIFLNPKSSQIDIAQSVGRVMRKAPHKKFGYVILPVVVKPDEKPEDALDHNDSYKTVWKVLQALRAHDDHFKAEINSLDFGDKSARVRVTHGGKETPQNYTDIDTAILNQYRQEIYIRMVRKCGDREYWDKWVKNLADLAEKHARTIKTAMHNSAVKSAFTKFVEGLRQNISPSITDDEAAEMLAQHITSRQVFDELFASFSQHNPVSKVMQKMLDTLSAQNIDISNPELENFYKYVHEAVKYAKTDEAKQELIRRIYNNFFKLAFPNTAKNLGIVYTPNEIIHFILRSADWAVKSLLNIPEGLSADGVHILDPFSGTGQFTARLLQIGLIPDAELKQKYKTEIHANEILLLAYYISAVNIEAAFQAKNSGKYLPFPGIVLTDTFNLPTDGAKFFDDPTFFGNSARIFEETKAKIHVIIGNPPYSVGKKSGMYEAVDGNIAKFYAAESTATNKNSLYDSYIRAIRWASDRIEKTGKGIICYVSNGSYIDSNSADGLRKCLREEFTHIYVFNLRGNQRGGDWRKEGAKVFGEGSQCPIAITLFVKDGKGTPCEIWYYEVGDYLTREEKLAELVRSESFGELVRAERMREIVPNGAGDWVNQRGEEFGGFVNLGNKNEPERAAIFGRRYSLGGQTARDAWCYNFSREALCENIRTLNPEALTEKSVRVGLYRPYVKMMMHFSDETNHRVFQMQQIFPKPDTKNLVICVSGIATKNFSVLMTDCIPGHDTLGKTQCFPLFWYEEVKSPLFGSYTARRDGISDEMQTLFRLRYHDGSITKEDIFCYVYGVLSSREYAARFGNDTKRVLARVPMVEGLERFCAFRDAGRELGRLHVGYEDVKGYAVREEWTGDVRDYTVKKMKVVARGGERVIRYSERLTIGGIPREAWEYVVNGRSAVEWIVERYSDSVDGKSGLRNDGNAWGRERGNERYVVELIGRVVSVSVETVKILRGMPELGV